MGIRHTKNFGIYHWDTLKPFGNDTILMMEADTLQEAIEKAKEHYGEKFDNGGADRIDIVDSQGTIVEQFTTG